MNQGICCIFNIAPHYRAAIYELMDKELKPHFHLGDRLNYEVKLMDYKRLNGFKKILKFKSIVGNWYWQSGAVSLAFKPYQHYIITGEPYCISTWIILILNKFTSKKTHLWTHGWYGDETGLKRIMKKIFFGLANSIVLYGDYAKNLMINCGFNPEKLFTIYNSLDYDYQVQLRSSLEETLTYKKHFENGYPVLLYIGRIQMRKKIELLIEALYKLHANNVYCNLILIGQQSNDTNIPNLVSNYKLDGHVWFYGACYDENILAELIYNADLCVSPGNVGLTAIHSLVYGTPVLTHDNFANQMPEFESIKPGVTGDFFKEGSVEDLCEKIVTWRSIKIEQKLFIRLKCYEIIAEKYNPHKQLQTLKSVLAAN